MLAKPKPLSLLTLAGTLLLLMSCTSKTSPPVSTTEVEVSQDARAWRSLEATEMAGRAEGRSIMAANSEGEEWVGVVADEGTADQRYYRVNRRVLSDAQLAVFDAGADRDENDAPILTLKWDAQGRLTSLKSR